MKYLILKNTSDHEIRFISHYDSIESASKAHFNILNFMFGKEGYLLSDMDSIFSRSGNLDFGALRKKKKKPVALTPLRAGAVVANELTWSVHTESETANFIAVDAAVNEDGAVDEDFDPFVEEEQETSVGSELDKKFEKMQREQNNLLYEKIRHIIDNDQVEMASAAFRSVMGLQRLKKYFFLEEKEFK